MRRVTNPNQGALLIKVRALEFDVYLTSRNSLMHCEAPRGKSTLNGTNYQVEGVQWHPVK